MTGARKGLVVCGEEDLDEISCAGRTYCWMLKERRLQANGDQGKESEVYVEHFTLHPNDFGLPAHPLSEVSPGMEPHQNAAILTKMLQNQLPRDDPIFHFVLMNTAALFVAAGVCNAESSNMGLGDDGHVVLERGPGGERWKEGVRRARWAVESGRAWEEWGKFVEVTNGFNRA